MVLWLGFAFGLLAV